MPLLHINAGRTGLKLHDESAPLEQTLQTALTGDGPVILMLHGYKYAPGHAHACPHDHIFSLTPRMNRKRANSWPRGLGFGQETENEGLAIAFGWPARGTIWQAYEQAKTVGLALAELIGRIHHIAPHRPIHALAHSLGARVVLSAIPYVASGAMRRVILMAGAEYGGPARAALNSAAGRQTEVINITSRDNDLFDFMMECLIPPAERGDRCLSLQMPEQPNTLTIQLDHGGTLFALQQAGFAIAPAKSKICHWSSYMRAGVFELYRALLHESDHLTLDDLRRLLPQHLDPRWSHVLAPPAFGLAQLSDWRAAP